MEFLEPCVFRILRPLSFRDALQDTGLPDDLYYQLDSEVVVNEPMNYLGVTILRQVIYSPKMLELKPPKSRNLAGILSTSGPHTTSTTGYCGVRES